MRKIVLLIVGCAMAVPAFAELQNVTVGPGCKIRGWNANTPQQILPPVDYSTVSTDTKAAAAMPKATEKTALQNITVDGSIRIRYSTGNRPSFSTQRIAVSYKAGKVAAGVVMQRCGRLGR